MRILLATDTYLPEINGVTTVLAAMRSGLLRRGHEILLVAPRYGGENGSEPGIIRLPSIPCPGYSQVHLSWPWGGRLKTIVERFQPGLVQAVTEGPIGSFALGYARRRRLPLVTSFHTDFPRYAGKYLGQWAVGPTRRWLRRFHSQAAFTMTPSARARQDLVHLGVPMPIVWGAGVDTSWFHPERRSPVRRETRGGDARLHVLHIGRLAVEKNVDTLVAAFQETHRTLGNRAVFCVAGDGPRAGAVRTALPFARHYGFLDRNEVADLYADADLFVFPSTTETCGLVVLEALASRVPVIGARAGGVPESILHGVTGFLAAPGDSQEFARAIIEFASSESLRYPMAEAARAFAVGKDWSGQLDILEGLYASIAQTDTATPPPISWPTTTSVG
jgi:glycosyltransferase involved in cell wall biosynthesis